MRAVGIRMGEEDMRLINRTSSFLVFYFSTSSTNADSANDFLMWRSWYVYNSTADGDLITVRNDEYVMQNLQRRTTRVLARSVIIDNEM